MPDLSLVVVRCADIDATARVLAAIGLRFSPEQHDSGPRHLVAVVGDGTVFELYPQRRLEPVGSERLGFRVPDVSAALSAAVEAGGKVVGTPTSSRAVISDPDGRKIEISAST